MNEIIDINDDEHCKFFLNGNGAIACLIIPGTWEQTFAIIYQDETFEVKYGREQENRHFLSQLNLYGSIEYVSCDFPWHVIPHSYLSADQKNILTSKAEEIINTILSNE